jgi:hypothetical protein
MNMDNDKIRDEANAKAKKIADEINAKAGITDQWKKATGHAYSTGFSLYSRRYTWNVKIRFEALSGGKPRRRTVNDCKNPIDVDKIAGLLVELKKYSEEQSKQWKDENARCDANARAADEIRADSPSWLTITSNANGLGIEADRLTADRVRAIVDAIKDVLP